MKTNALISWPNLKLGGLAAFGLSCLTLATPALALPDDTIYLSFDVGPAWMQDTKVTQSVNPNVPVGRPLRFDLGIRTDIAAGFRFTRCLAAELELGLTFTEVQDSSGIPLANEGSDVFVQVPIMGNLVYHYRNHTKWQPFVGAGVGGVENLLEQRQTWSGFGYSSSVRESAFVLGYQGFAGIRYEIAKQMILGLQYRYMATTEQDYSHKFGFKMDGVTTHAVTLTFTAEL